MSNSLINGFSDILSRANLTTNGSFKINHRNNFISLTACSVNDYISDCWFISAMNVDYCEALQTAAGYIRFKGYGKKRQRNPDCIEFSCGRKGPEK